jgi:adenine/guanine phosphoribosyltransferase-like PRPP-binding protein
VRRLAQEKAARAHRQSRIRALLSQRNEAVAAAVAGGVPAAAVAAATGLKITEVRKMGRAFSESYFPDLSREQHLAGLAVLAEQLQAVTEGEGKRRPKAAGRRRRSFAQRGDGRLPDRRADGRYG